ncbi:MAG TPA: type II secretion system F family protein [Acidimicrobiales bacterium]|nr:type II secretion system F family protein [Acidimicrobiales bacterium]
MSSEFETPSVVGSGLGVAVAVLVFVTCSSIAFRRARTLRGRRAPWAPTVHRDLRSTIRQLGLLRRRSERAADRALPDALERVARSLRAGSSLHAALATAQPESPVLLATEWRRLTAASQADGVAVACAAWRGTRPSAAIDLAAAALSVAAEVGGEQARAVDSVAVTLRQRLALDAEIAALGAQARASAVVLAVSPVAFAVLAAGIEPSYLRFLLGTPSGWAMTTAGLALEAVGIAWMVRISGVAK